MSSKSKVLFLILCFFTITITLAAENEILVVNNEGEMESNVEDDWKKSEDENVKELFIPTNEWQTILPGQAIPRGLHVRINLETGLKEAKLMDNNENTIESLKAKLSKIPNEDRQTDAPDNAPKAQFRSIEVLKEEFAKAKLNISTEAEIMSTILSKCFDKDITEEQKASLFDELEFYVHQYDNAQDFIKMGGLLLVTPAFNSSVDNLRISAAHLIGSAMQGNPKVQISTIESGMLPLLLHQLSIDSIRVQIKLLYALSNMIRGLPGAQKKFMDLGGMSVLSKFFNVQGEDYSKLQLKSITLIYDLIMEKKSISQNAGPGDGDKIKVYGKVNALENFVKHGWCEITPKLVVLQNNDEIVEKVLLLMQSTITSCHEHYLSFVPQIKILQQKYSQLVSQQIAQDVEPDENSYFYELLQLTNSVLSNLSEGKDEL